MDSAGRSIKMTIQSKDENVSFHCCAFFFIVTFAGVKGEETAGKGGNVCLTYFFFPWPALLLAARAMLHYSPPPALLFFLFPATTTVVSK